MLNQSFDGSYEDASHENSQSINQHHTLFQKYSRSADKNNNSFESANHGAGSHDVSHGSGQQQQNSSPHKKIVQSEVQILSDEGQKESLIQKVDKQESFNESQPQQKNGQDLARVPDINSKIIHIPIAQQPAVLSQQTTQTQSIIQHQVVNQPLSHQTNQHTLHQTGLRQTLPSNPNVPQRDNHQVPVNQQFSTRGSLPPNMNPPQFYVNQQPHGYYIQQQNIHQINQVNQVNRIPQHMPQSLIQPLHNQSQNQFKPIDFIQQGQQKLQKSEIVYTNRNPNLQNNQMMTMNHYPHIQNKAFGQEEPQMKKIQNQIFTQNEETIKGTSLSKQRQNTRSLSQRKTNIIFNYNIQNQGVSFQPIPVFSQIPIQVVQNQGPVSLSLNQPTRSTDKKKVVQAQSSKQIIPAKSQKKLEIKVQKSLQPKPKQKTQVSDPKPIEKQEKRWKQSYFALYSKFTSINRKVEQVSESFYIYQKIISTIKQQKIITKHKHIKYTIQQLQQQTTQIIHEWKPTTILQNGKVLIEPAHQKNNAIKSTAADNTQTTKDHLQMKYKRLLYSFSKLQQQNATVKKNFEQKINQVVKKLEQENASLKSKIEKVQKQKLLKKNSFEQVQSLFKKSSKEYLRNSPNIYLQPSEEVQEDIQVIEEWVKNVTEIIQTIEQHNKELEAKYTHLQGQLQTKDQEVARLNSLITQTSSKPVEASKPEAVFTLSQRNELQENLSNYYQRIIMLESEIQRLNEKNDNLIESHRSKQSQFRSYKQSQSTDYSNIKKTIDDLNNKLKDYQRQINDYQEEVQNLNTRNSQLERELVVSNQKVKSTVSSLNVVDNRQYLKEIQEKSKQITQLQIQKVTVNQKSIVLSSELQRLNDKVSTLQIKLKESQQLQSKAQEPTVIKQVIPEQNPLLIQQYEFTISTLRSQISRKQNQIQRQSKLSDQRVLDLTQQLKMSYKQRQNLHKRYEQRINLLQVERQKKQISFRQLRDKIYEFEQRKKSENNQQIRRNQYMNKIASYNENQQTIKLKSEIENLKSQKEKLVKDNQIQMKKIEDQNNQLKQDSLRLKKQIGEFANNATQIEALSEELSRKNMEILELQNKLFEGEKVIVENSNLKRQIERLSQESIRLSTEYDRVNKLYTQTSRNLKELQQSLNTLGHKFNTLQGEYNLALQANDRKDHQIVKLRQSNQLLETNVDEVQRENQKFQVKIRNLQITYEHETSLFKEQIQSLRSKMSDYDNLIRQKSVSQHRLVELQSQVQKFEYQAQQNGELITKQKNKIKTLQSQNQDLTSEIQSLTQKYNDQQKKHIESIKKYKKSNDQLTEKNKSLQQKQLKFQKQKISELQHDVKSKQNKIWKLEKENQELLERLDQVGDQQIDGQKITLLQQKVKEYQARLFNQTFKFGPTNYDYQATKVFQRKVIYELKEENERLREFISTKRSEKPTKDRNMQASKVEQQIKQAYDEELDEVQNRLQSFNNKLQNLISNGTYQNNEGPIQKSRRSPLKVKVVQNESAENINTLLAAQNTTAAYELRQLRLKYAELQRYCKNIEVQLLTGNLTKKQSSSSRTLVSNQTQQNLINDQITFQKQKNKELQERVDKLLKMNTQLKSSLDDLLKQRNQSSNINYYKEQIIEFTEKINILEVRIKKLIEENQCLKQFKGDQIKGEQFNIAKLYDTQRKLIQLQRNQNQLSLHKTSLLKEVQSLKQSLQKKQYQIKELTNQLSSTGQKESTAILSYRQQINNYETQITKLTNRLRINESQNERLNQVLKKKQAEATQQVSRWRNKVNQLQQQINRIVSQTEKEKSGQSNLKIEVSRFNQQLKSVQYQNQELKENNQILIRKLQQSQVKLKQMQLQFYELENDLMGKRVDQSQWNMKFQQYQVENVKFRNQIEFLKQQIQRLNEELRNKYEIELSFRQKYYENELQNVKGKLGLTEREQLNFKKNASSWESQKQIYQGELAKLKSQVAIFGAQIERRDSQFSVKQRRYEQKISILKTQITQMQTNFVSLQQNSSSWGPMKQRYEIQIVQLKNQVSILKSQIERLNGISREKQSLYKSLQLNCSAWTDEKQNYERELTKIYNQNEILKSEIQRLNLQLVEKDKLVSSSRGTSQSWNAQKQNYELQITRLSNQVSVLRQQSYRLNQVISQYELKLAQSGNTSTSELIKLRKDNQELKVQISKLREQLNVELAELEGKMGIELSEYKQRLGAVYQQFESIAYYVELSRSLYLELQSLLDEKQVCDQQEEKKVNTRIAEQLEKGLRILMTISEVISAGY